MLLMRYMAGVIVWIFILLIGFVLLILGKKYIILLKLNKFILFNLKEDYSMQKLLA